jgi:hypothetical protein
MKTTKLLKKAFRKTIDAEDGARYEVQRGAAIENVVEESTSAAYKTQRGVSVPKFELYLTTNEAFFTSKGKTKFRGKYTRRVDDDLNQNKYFSSTHKLNTTKDAFFWGIWCDSDTGASINARMDVENYQAEYTVTIDGVLSSTMSLHSTSSKHYVLRHQIRNLKRGFHTIELRLTGIVNMQKDVGVFRYVKLTSKKQIRVVRERWRPLAAHTRFKSSSVKHSDAWAMVVHRCIDDGQPAMGAYHPLTTPFGYFGPVTNSNGAVTGVNFSLWSFKKGTIDLPPRHKWSRLLAIGASAQSGASFGEFFHEGTGVKPRGFNPWESEGGTRHYSLALAYEKEPDELGDGDLYTYYAYYFNDAAEEWKLFAAGQEFRSTPLNHLWCKSFVEVPGPADHQRSNHVPRRVEYQGMCRDAATGEWHPFDEMVSGLTSDDKRRGITNKKWEVVADPDGNQVFSVSTGGLEQRNVSHQPSVLTLKHMSVTPRFHSCIGSLSSPLPFPEVLHASISPDTRKLVLSVYIPTKLDPHSDVVVFYGPKDGLTIERLWSKKKTFHKIPHGETSLVLDTELEVSATQFVRVLSKDSHLQIFSKHTYVIPPVIL